MADSTKSAKNSKSAKPRDTPAKRHTRGKKGAEPDAAERSALAEVGDDVDLRTRIARRAYEISQGERAGDDAENWLQAEREVRGA
jgi:ribosome-binding protein aMBF1 (putative translation factor)